MRVHCDYLHCVASIYKNSCLIFYGWPTTKKFVSNSLTGFSIWSLGNDELCIMGPHILNLKDRLVARIGVAEYEWLCESAGICPSGLLDGSQESVYNVARLAMVEEKVTQQ